MLFGQLKTHRWYKPQAGAFFRYNSSAYWFDKLPAAWYTDEVITFTSICLSFKFPVFNSVALVEKFANVEWDDVTHLMSCECIFPETHMLDFVKL
jgi:hypothetical protein